MAQPLIRHANEEDIRSIHRMQEDWAKEEITYGFVPASAKELRKRIGTYFLVAEADDNLLGFIVGSTQVSEGTAVIPQGEDYLEIDDLYVAPSFRDRGIGDMLVEQLLLEAKKADIHHALVYSASRDIPSILKFYKAHSFENWYIRMFRQL